LKLAKDDEPVIYVPVMIAAWTGLRLGEVLGLPWRNVHLTGEVSYLEITQAFQMVQEDNDYIKEYGPPKSCTSNRMVPISDELAEVLKAEKRHQITNRKLFKERYYQDDDLVCCQPDGTPYTR
jgi:integrase